MIEQQLIIYKKTVLLKFLKKESIIIGEIKLLDFDP